MPLLNCSVKTCVYNSHKKCNLGNIRVEGVEANVSDATACGSFRDKEETEVVKDACCGKKSDKTRVDCTAEHCEFNEKHICEAAKIEVDGSTAKNYHDTRCSSFILR